MIASLTALGRRLARRGAAWVLCAPVERLGVRVDPEESPVAVA
jgi:hypothetical protein